MTEKEKGSIYDVVEKTFPKRYIDHQNCYMLNKICNDDCAEVREQLDSKYAEMNKDK